jgi:hypothetical protein
MAINKNGFTTLGPKEYQKQALEIKNNYDGKNWFPEVKRLLGRPKWEGVEYKFKSSGKGKIGKVSLLKDIENKKKSGQKRNVALAKANKLIGKTLKDAGEQKAKAISNLGKSRNADHILEVQTFGPVLELLDQELEAGIIDKKEYNKRLKIIKSYKPGDHPENLQNLHYAANNDKKDEVKAKNKLLEKMEKTNPSLRNRNPKMQALLASIFGKKKTRNLSGITAVVQDTYTTEFTPKNGNDTNGKTNGHTNGKVTNGESTKVPTNGKTNGFKNGGKKIVLNGNKTNNYRGLSTLMEQPNTWSDPLLMAPPIRTLDKSIDVRL